MQDGDGGDDEERERRGGSGLGGAVSPACLKVANGLRYHLIDIYVDEIEKLSPPTSEEEGTAFEQANYPLVELVSPFENLVLKSPTKLVRERVREMLLDERLERWGYLSPNVKRKGKKGRKGKVDGSDAEMGDDGEDSDEEWGGFGN